MLPAAMNQCVPRERCYRLVIIWQGELDLFYENRRIQLNLGTEIQILEIKSNYKCEKVGKLENMHV